MSKHGQIQQNPKAEHSIRHASAMVKQEIRSGPLPAPEDLERYNQIVANGAERIMKMAENQHAHRIGMESKVITSQNFQSLLGVIFAFILGLTGIVGSIYLIMNGHEVGGTVLSGISLTSLVSAFIYGKKEQRKDLDSKK